MLACGLFGIGSFAAFYCLLNHSESNSFETCHRRGWVEIFEGRRVSKVVLLFENLRFFGFDAASWLWFLILVIEVYFQRKYF